MDTEYLIEQVARAMCEAVGKNPDDDMNYDSEYVGCFGPRWKSMRKEAKMQIAAYRRIQALR